MSTFKVRTFVDLGFEIGPSTEVDEVEADRISIDTGDLVLYDIADNIVAAYAEGHWLKVDVIE